MDECLFPLSYEYVSIDETSPWLISGKFSNNSLKEIEDAIIYSAPCYLTDTGNEIAITHQFMIKLKKSSDYQILLDFAQQNNAVIIMRNNIPLWYTLSCSEHSSENALQLAIRAYESGLFSYANACFLEDSIPITSYVSYNDPLYSYQWYLNHSLGYVILRCIDASSISYIPITIHNNYANRIENHLTDNNWNPIWESNLIVMQ